MGDSGWWRSTVGGPAAAHNQKLGRPAPLADTASFMLYEANQMGATIDEVAGHRTGRICRRACGLSGDGRRGRRLDRLSRRARAIDQLHFAWDPRDEREPASCLGEAQA